MTSDDKLLKLVLSQQVSRNINENLGASLIGYVFAQRANRQSEWESEIMQWWETLITWWNNFISNADGYFFNISPMYESWKDIFPMAGLQQAYDSWTVEFIERAKPLATLINQSKLQKAYDFHKKVDLSSAVNKLVSLEDFFTPLKELIEKAESDLAEIFITLDEVDIFFEATSTQIWELFEEAEAEALVNTFQNEYLLRVDTELREIYISNVSLRKNGFEFIKENHPIDKESKNNLQKSFADGLKTLQILHEDIIEYRDDLLEHIESKKLKVRMKKFKPVNDYEPERNSLVENLSKLVDLLEAGVLTQDDFNIAKRKILDDGI